MTRSRFAAYVAMLIVTLVLISNLDFTKALPSILLVSTLLIISAAAAPFIFGFILQAVLYRLNISKGVSLLLAVILTVSLWHFSGYQFLKQRTNLFIELFLLTGSIIVVKGFIDSGANFFQKIRDKRACKKSTV